MDKMMKAVEVNRHFSRVLREMRDGERVIVTAHGKPVAEMALPVRGQDEARQAAAAGAGRSVQG